MPSGYLRFSIILLIYCIVYAQVLFYLGAGDDMLQLDPFHPTHFTNSSI